MIPEEYKRLAKVDFPIAVASNHPAGEKSVRHGRPSMLCLGCVRRRLAACRATLLALLLANRCDEPWPIQLHDLPIKATGEKKQNKAPKVSAARTLWVPAVNNRGGLSRWAFVETDNPWDAKTLI